MPTDTHILLKCTDWHYWVSFLHVNQLPAKTKKLWMWMFVERLIVPINTRR